MLERQSPLTVGLGSLALWSAGVVVLSLFGLGGQVGPHPDNPALAPPLPELPAVAEASTGLRKDAVAVIAARPVFLPTRRPAPIAAAAGNEGERRFNGSLTSVLMAGELRLAILSSEGDQQPLRVRLGEAVPGTALRLVQLEPRRAVLEGPEGQQELALRVFDGQGGAAPTPAAVAPAPPPPTANASPSPVGTTSAVAPPNADEQAQIDAIRQRIAARRAQLQQQQAGQAPDKPDEERP